MLLNYLLNSWKIGVTTGTFLTKVLFLILTDLFCCSQITMWLFCSKRIMDLERMKRMYLGGLKYIFGFKQVLVHHID